PAGATTGPISITTPAGTVTSGQAFTVIGGAPHILTTINPPLLLPTHLKISADGRRAYVVNQSRNNVSVIDTASHSIIATIPPGNPAFRSGVTADGTRLYVLTAGDVSVSVLDLANNRLLTTIPLLATNVALMTMTPDGRNVLVSHPTNDIVSLIDTATNTVVATIPTGRQPDFIVASTDNRRVHVHNAAADTVTVIDIPTRSVTATIATGQFSGSPTFGLFTTDGARYYTTDSGANVIVIDTATNAVTRIGGFGSPIAAALNPSGTR